MKRRLFTASLIVAFAPAMLRAADSIYIWDGVKIVPPDVAPQIDALTVVNNGTISLDFTNFDSIPFDTTSTLNFTNTLNGYLNCNQGFRFDTAPASFGQRQRAVNFENDGVISSGAHAIDVTKALTNLTLVGSVLLGSGAARTYVNAENVISPGTFDLEFESLLHIDGGSVDLSRGKFDMQTSGLGVTTIGGPLIIAAPNVTNVTAPFLFVNSPSQIWDGYWTIGTNLNIDIVNPADQYGAQSTSQPELVEDRQYNFFAVQIGSKQSVTYVNQFFTNPSNVVTRVVYLNTTNAAFKPSVYFYLNAIDVEWIAHPTNLFDTNTTVINFLDFGPGFSFPNGVAGGLRLTSIPINFVFNITNQSLIGGVFPGIPPTGPSSVPPGLFPNFPEFVTFANYEAWMPATTRVMTDVLGQDVTNLQGRIEVNADNFLDLSYSRITSDNYLKLKAPSQFAGNAGSRIYSPYTDLNLRNTNGTFAISNLLQTIITKPEGTIEVYSGAWVDIGPSITNNFEVLFVDARVSPTTPARQQDTVLRSTTPSGQGGDNLVLSDVLTVTRSMLLDTERLTITTNTLGAAYPSGGIQIVDPNIIWTTSAPRLRYLTNNGFIGAENAVFFGGSRTSPVDSSVVNVPYEVFINSGGITNHGSLIWAKLFENSGTFLTLSGDINLQQAQAAILTNGMFWASNGNISVQGNGLFISNHVFNAAGAITLSPSVSLDDGTFASGCPELNTNKNFWVCSGLNLTIAAPQATLASTTVTNIAAPFQNIVNRWAAADRGPTPAGFDNDNTPVGHLILSGGQNSLFTFSAAGGGNAIYVDRLDLENYTTNYIGSDLVGVSIDPNMKVYYAQAFDGNVSVAEKINGYNGGRLVWVSNYNCGFFSSTNLVYFDGTTNRVNAALAGSCNLDSNTNGLVNCVDPSPIPTNQLSACSCNPINIGLPVTLGTGGDGSGSGAGSSSSSGSQLGFPTVPGSGQSNSVQLASSSYSGLFYETNGVAAPSAGYFSAVMNAKGLYTGKISSGGSTYSFSGKIDPVTGQSSARVSRGMLHSLTVNLQLDSAANQIRGTVTDGNWTANLMADKLVFSKSAHANQAGAYTLVIPGDLEDTNSPAGPSVGMVNVDGSGNVTWSGALADGAKVSQKSVISGEGIWPMYSSLYSGKGCMLGWIQVTNSSVGGDLIWIKPAGVPDNYYPNGFTNLIESIGSPYHKPAAGARVLDWNGGLGELSISGGGLSQSWTNEIRLELNNRVTNLSGPKLTLTITPSSGLFRGTFVDPDSQKSEPFQGVLFQDNNTGVGYFLGPDRSGEIQLGPAP
jgi:hypothetical protein